MLVEISLNLIISILGLLFSAIALIYTYINSAKKLEHRLTSLEHKIEPIWDAIRNEIPKLLIKEGTKELDKLLRMTSEGLDNMTDKQVHDMIRLLEEEYTKAMKTGDSGRAVGIALFRATLKERHI